MALEFSEKAKQEIVKILEKYPDNQSATLPVLYVAQHEFGYLSDEAIQLVAETLGLPAPIVSDTASFYTMFYRQPMGKYVIQVCSTLSCAICGSQEIEEAITEVTGIKPGETSEDGKFSFLKVECLGSCGTAPVVQINYDYYEEVTPEKIKEILKSLP